MIETLYVIQHFDNNDWVVNDVKSIRGERSEYHKREIARIASQGYFDAVQWDINRPVRLLQINRDADGNTTSEIVLCQHSVFVMV
tara:strand:+ start:84 stop:338 length:255 start_codon:yes stop_codon:yes gene_type:complete